MNVPYALRPVTPPGAETRKQECLAVCTRLLDDIHYAVQKNELDVTTDVTLEDINRVSGYKELKQCFLEFKSQNDSHINRIGKILEKIFKICRSEKFEVKGDIVVVNLEKYPKLFDSHL